MFLVLQDKLEMEFQYLSEQMLFDAAEVAGSWPTVSNNTRFKVAHQLVHPFVLVDSYAQIIANYLRILFDLTHSMTETLFEC